MHSTNKPHHPKASKAVLERQKTSRHLLATLEALDSPTKTTTTAPIPTALLHGLAPWLHHSITELVALDEKVFTHRAQLTQARQQRDKALRQLAHDVAQLRLSIENQYRAPEIENLGFESPTPRSPQPLLRVATRVAKNLTQPDLANRLGQPWYQNPFDPTTHQSKLAQQIEALHHLLHQVDTLQRDLDQARIHRQKAQKDHDILTRETRQIIESVERLGQLAQTPAHQPPELQASRPRQKLVPGASRPSPGSRRDPIPKNSFARGRGASDSRPDSPPSFHLPRNWERRGRPVGVPPALMHPSTQIAAKQTNIDNAGYGGDGFDNAGYGGGGESRALDTAARGSNSLATQTSD